MQRHTSIGRDSDTESTDPTSRFTYRLRSTRPKKKAQGADGNDSVSSGEEDDEDGFEILTAENLFSTLLQRVSHFFLVILRIFSFFLLPIVIFLEFWNFLYRCEHLPIVSISKTIQAVISHQPDL